MDILSHGLWGAMPFYKKNRRYYWLAFLFGILPDLIVFGPHFFLSIYGRLWNSSQWYTSTPGNLPPLSSFNPIVFTLYNFTHNLVVFAAVVVIVCGFRKKWFPPFFAWGLHILMDIPTHSTQFFATPFLWPLSSFKVNGYSWGHAWFLLANYALLLGIYIFLHFRRKRTMKESHVLK